MWLSCWKLFISCSNNNDDNNWDDNFQGSDFISLTIFTSDSLSNSSDGYVISINENKYSIGYVSMYCDTDADLDKYNYILKTEKVLTESQLSKLNHYIYNLSKYAPKDSVNNCLNNKTFKITTSSGIYSICSSILNSNSSDKYVQTLQGLIHEIINLSPIDIYINYNHDSIYFNGLYCMLNYPFANYPNSLQLEFINPINPNDKSIDLNRATFKLNKNSLYLFRDFYICNTGVIIEINEIWINFYYLPKVKYTDNELQMGIPIASSSRIMTPNEYQIISSYLKQIGDLKFNYIYDTNVKITLLTSFEWSNIIYLNNFGNLVALQDINIMDENFGYIPHIEIEKRDKLRSAFKLIQFLESLWIEINGGC